MANLAPRKVLGLERMLLMAENRDGRLHPATADAQLGSTVK